METKNKMIATMKTGEKVEIDTVCLFNNQYNTIDGKRIFDKDIKSIENDARIGKGKCRYCGAIVERGKEEPHYLERESKNCDNCFWQQNRLLKTDKKSHDTKNGKITITTDIYKKQCTFDCGKTQCTNTECRAYGIEWFTEKNTFFIAFPDGLPEISAEKFKSDFIESSIVFEYYKKIGTYELYALKNESGNVESFTLYNARNNYRFRYINGHFYTDKYSFGMRQKFLENIPQSVIDKVIKICIDLEA